MGFRVTRDGKQVLSESIKSGNIVLDFTGDLAEMEEAMKAYPNDGKMRVVVELGDGKITDLSCDISGASENERPQAETAEAKTEIVTEPADKPYVEWTVNQLKEELGKRELSTTGNKGELIERLDENDEAETTEAKTEPADLDYDGWTDEQIASELITRKIEYDGTEREGALQALRAYDAAAGSTNS